MDSVATVALTAVLNTEVSVAGAVGSAELDGHTVYRCGAGLNQSTSISAIAGGINTASVVDETTSSGNNSGGNSGGCGGGSGSRTGT